MSTGSPPADPTGYLHPSYARAFSLGATPRHLAHAGGWILERVIPGTVFMDGMGCYPLLACRDWSGLPDDWTALAERLVAVVAVPDPFGSFTAAVLHRAFDVVRPYKAHFIADLREASTTRLPERHRRNLNRARRRLTFDVSARPEAELDTWMELYGGLCARKGIVGLRAFSRESFRTQMAVPGLVMVRARCDDAVVGLHLWYLHGDVAYGHLGATSAAGDGLSASYGLYAAALDSFRSRVRWVDLGSSAGEPDAPEGAGLRRFKAGWATGTKPTWLCGRILQPATYARLTSMAGATASTYLPAYRDPAVTTALRAARDGHV